MPKLGMDKVRRKQLVNATLEVIRDHGVAGASVSQISARAGLANGMIHHYFADKEALFEATFSELLSRMATELLSLLGKAKTPLDRVYAFVEGNLSAESFTQENVAVWLAFWAQVPHTPRLQRIHNLIARRTQAGLFRALMEILPREDAARHARAITIFVDGLWLRAAVDLQGMNRAAARQLAHEFLSRQLGIPMPKLDQAFEQ